MKNNIGAILLAFVMIAALTVAIFYQVFASDIQKANQAKSSSSARVVSSIIASSIAQVPSSVPVAASVSPAKPFDAADTVVGTGAEVKSGSTVTIHYKGMLTDGTVFDSSYTRNTPFSTQIGTGMVIKGWDEGLIGMKVGGKRTLTIDPSYGYGARAQGKIPANSVLIFETELLDVK
jgi:FKBP-type peptidyl-prolyl cis-trans isomerase FkpA